MAKFEILHFPDERLRIKALPISIIDRKIKEIAHNMVETMYAEAGIGLAAPQVNIQKRIVAIDLSEDKSTPMVLVNPVILEKAGVDSMREGCLSVPDFFDVVERAERIKFQYQTLENKTNVIEASGLLAICVQHEVDHLDGKLFIDYLSPLKRQRLKKKLVKREKPRQIVL